MTHFLFFKSLFGDPALWKVAKPLLLADVILVLIHATFAANRDSLCVGSICNWVTLEAEYGLPALYMFAKFTAIIVIMFLLFRTTRAAPFLCLSLALSIMLFDDALEIHEQGGAFFVDALGLSGAAGLRAQDIGELLVWSLLGLPVLALLAWGALSKSAVGKPTFWVFIGLIAALMFFAIVVDAAHSALPRTLFRDISYANQLIGIVEDSGEMVVLSIMLAVAITIYHRRTAGR